uniref:Uncharacterized protein n=1 Tax=Avena sativa TaxID=4498 RepID=A0ACD5W478_AVESA
RIPATVRPSYGTICPIPDVAGEQLPGEAASTDLRAGSIQAICSMAQSIMQQQKGLSFDQLQQQVQFVIIPWIVPFHQCATCTSWNNAPPPPAVEISPTPYSIPACAGGACC